MVVSRASFWLSPGAGAPRCCLDVVGVRIWECTEEGPCR